MQEQIIFPSDGLKLSGIVHLPEDIGPGGVELAVDLPSQI
jgi:hypothetical protein